MRSSRRLAMSAAAAGVILALLSGACGSSSKSTGTAAAGSGRVSGTLTVFAAASLTGAFNRAKPTIEGAHPGLTVNYNFAGSNALAAQIQQGAPADVFASADMANMQKLVDAGVVEAPVTFARNKLEIAVAAGNPKGITGLADLAKPGVTTVLEAPGVPAGDYTRQVLAAKGIAVKPRSLESDVKAALTKVSSGEADATVVYVTDLKGAGTKVTGVTVPDSDQPAITYPIAVVKATRNHAAAQAFVQAAVAGDVQRSLVDDGFVAPQ